MSKYWAKVVAGDKIYYKWNEVIPDEMWNVQHQKWSWWENVKREEEPKPAFKSTSNMWSSQLPTGILHHRQ